VKAAVRGAYYRTIPFRHFLPPVHCICCAGSLVRFPRAWYLALDVPGVAGLCAMCQCPCSSKAVVPHACQVTVTVQAWRVVCDDLACRYHMLIAACRFMQSSDQTTPFELSDMIKHQVSIRASMRIGGEKWLKQTWLTGEQQYLPVAVVVDIQRNRGNRS
jgi:hypothetical protein